MKLTIFFLFICICYGFSSCMHVWESFGFDDI